MVTILLAGMLAFGVTYTLIPSIMKISRMKRLLDTADERKWHKDPTPTMGGIAIFFGIAVALLLFLGDSALMEVKNVLAMGLLLTLVGIKDDLIGVAPSWRLMVQAVIATVLFFSGVYLDSFYGIFGLYEIPILFGWLLNMLIITTVINAYNLIDGINGLSGGLGVIASSAFGMLFLSAGEIGWAMIAFVMCASLLAFLRFNFGKGEIFMGDTGTMILGFMISVFCIQFTNIGFYDLEMNFVTMLVYSIIIVPLLDLVRVFFTRIVSGKSPFSPDRSHVHHFFVDMGASHNNACFWIYGFNLVCILLVFQMNHMALWIQFTVLTLLAALSFVALYMVNQYRRKEKFRAKVAQIIPFGNQKAA
ncbi:MAG: MraY family glycosyltransferase [Bacteroidota bacterium]